METQAKYGSQLTIWSDCFVTKILFDNESGPDDKKRRAIGVEYLKGEKLYRAHITPNKGNGVRGSVRLKTDGEIVLCGGTFNIPQLLMLSGIGEREQLEQREIQCRVDSPGVGKNLRDRGK